MTDSLIIKCMAGVGVPAVIAYLLIRPLLIWPGDHPSYNAFVNSWLIGALATASFVVCALIFIFSDRDSRK